MSRPCLGHKCEKGKVRSNDPHDLCFYCRGPYHCIDTCTKCKTLPQGTVSGWRRRQHVWKGIDPDGPPPTSKQVLSAGKLKLSSLVPSKKTNKGTHPYAKPKYLQQDILQPMFHKTNPIVWDHQQPQVQHVKQKGDRHKMDVISKPVKVKVKDEVCISTNTVSSTTGQTKVPPLSCHTSSTYPEKYAPISSSEDDYEVEDMYEKPCSMPKKYYALTPLNGEVSTERKVFLPHGGMSEVEYDSEECNSTAVQLPTNPIICSQDSRFLFNATTVKLDSSQDSIDSLTRSTTTDTLMRSTTTDTLTRSTTTEGATSNTRNQDSRVLLNATNFSLDSVSLDESSEEIRGCGGTYDDASSPVNEIDGVSISETLFTNCSNVTEDDLPTTKDESIILDRGSDKIKQEYDDTHEKSICALSSVSNKNHEFDFPPANRPYGPDADYYDLMDKIIDNDNELLSYGASKYQPPPPLKYSALTSTKVKLPSLPIVPAFQELINEQLWSDPSDVEMKTALHDIRQRYNVPHSHMEQYLELPSWGCEGQKTPSEHITDLKYDIAAQADSSRAGIQMANHLLLLSDYALSKMDSPGDLKDCILAIQKSSQHFLTIALNTWRSTARSNSSLAILEESNEKSLKNKVRQFPNMKQISASEVPVKREVWLGKTETSRHRQIIKEEQNGGLDSQGHPGIDEGLDMPQLCPEKSSQQLDLAADMTTDDDPLTVDLTHYPESPTF